MQPTETRSWRRRFVPALLVAGLLTSACGSRLSHERVLALNTSVGGGGTNASGTLAAGSGGSGGGLSVGDAIDGDLGGFDGDGGFDGGGFDGGAGGDVGAGGGGDVGAGGGGGDAGPAAGGGGGPVVGGGGGGRGGGPATGTPIVIGNIGNYSGVVGAIYKQAQSGIRAWAKSVNDRGGINGHPVQLLTADDGGDPTKALSLARDFVENRGAIAFVGNFTTLTTNSYRKYLEEKQIPVIGGDTVTPDWEESPMLFPQGSQAKGQHLGTLALGVRQGLTKVGVVHCVEVFACVYIGDIQQAGGGAVGAQVLDRIAVSLLQVDFTSECIRLRDKGIEHVMVGMDGNGVRKLIDSCATQNYRPQFSAPSIALTADVLTSANVNGLQTGASNFPFPATDIPGAQEFNSEIRRITGNPPSSGPEAAAWVSGKLLEVAGRNLPANPTSADVLEGLWQIRDEDLGGLTVPLTFNRNAPATVGACYFNLRIENQKFTAPEGSKRTCF